jgi:L-iditol 2-dehydrogenase
MKSVRLHGLGDLRLHEEQTPAPGPGEVLLRVGAIGICASDLHWFCEGSIGDARLKRPLVLGHEFSAQVVESSDPRLPPGARVAVDPAIPCEQCEFCLQGDPNLCENLRFAGHGQEDGAQREYMPWPARCCFPIPDTFSDADGVVLEPLGIAIHAVDLAHMRPGMRVGVYGCGPIGLLTLQMARLAGAAEIYATDLYSHRLEAARAMGATAAFQAGTGEETGQIMAATRGRGVHVAFEAAGENPAVEAAIETARPGGRVVLIGIPSEDRTSFTASIARRKGLTIVMVRRMKLTYPRAIELVARGLVEVRSLVTHRFPLAEFVPAFEVAVKRQGIKIILEA